VTARRIVAVLVVAAAIAALAVADHRATPRTPAARSTRVFTVDDRRFSVSGTPGVGMPVAFPAGSLRSTWFCAAGTAADAKASTDHVVVMANPLSTAVHATITVYPGTVDTDPKAAEVAAKGTAVRELTLAGHARTSVRLGDILSAPFAAALVEADAGEIAVEESLGTGPAASSTPCASAATASWFTAGGTTAKGHQELLALFNPFADHAVVDLDFATSDGLRLPEQYQGFIVPGGRVVVIDVGAAVSRHDHVSVSVLARSGRLVMQRLQLSDGTNGPKGASVGGAAPEPATAWAFPEGTTANGVTETYDIYNPTESEAAVELAIALDHPKVNGEVDPVAVDVPPRSAVHVRLNDEQRVPLGVNHAVLVHTVNNVPVVAEREITSVSPGPRTGTTYALGAAVAAPEWVVPAGGASATTSEWLVLYNPSASHAVRASVRAMEDGRLVDLEHLGAVSVPPASRVAVEASANLQRDVLPLVVSASGPLVVERGVYPTSGNGFSQGMGIPLAAGAHTISP
jgi:hypothetical protein